MSSHGSVIAASVGLGILAFFLLLAIVGALYLRRYLKRLDKTKPNRKLGTYITPKQPPEFQIPPYMLITADESDDTETMSEAGEKLVEEATGILSAPAMGRSLSMPSDPRGLKRGRSGTDDSDGTGFSTKEYRPQYRRAVSQFAPLTQERKFTPRKPSVAPYGKLEVSLQFVSVKNLLFVQVNGAFDLPQVRLSGVSTPYVRVYLLSAEPQKEPRSCFINLGTNRICVFDKITLVEAQRSTLKFIVLDYDKFSRSEFVAEVMLSLLEVDLMEGATVSRHLNSKAVGESANRGSLTVSLCQQPTAGQLTVIILKAEGLPPPKSDVAGGLDTFVKVVYYVQSKAMEKKKTKVVKKSVSPVFNEAFIFDMEEDLKHSAVMCEVYRGDTVLKTERIGRIVLGLESFGSEIRHWNDMIMAPQKRVTETHSLRS